MTTFARTYNPYSCDMAMLPARFESASQSGKIVTRELVQAGRSWVETYSAIPVNATSRAWVALINKYSFAGTIIEVSHPIHSVSYGTLALEGGYSYPTINGASQTGKTISTTHWASAAQTLLAAGDYVRIGNVMYEIDADVVADGASNTYSLTFTSPVYSAPTNGSDIIVSSPTFRCVLSLVSAPIAQVGNYFTGFTLVFKEAL